MTTIVSALNELMPRANWSLGQTNGGLDLRFTCHARGSIRFTDQVLEDTRDAIDSIVRQSERVYFGRHLAFPHVDVPPLLSCPRCLHLVPMPNEERMTHDELTQHCERMGVLWLERAQRLLTETNT